MPQHQQKKLTKSKKWIDYSSEEENDHHDQEKPNKQHHNHHHQKLESHSQIDNNKDQQRNLPLLSTSHEPVNRHLLQDRKDLLQQLRLVRGNTVWISLNVSDDRNVPYLIERIEQLKKENNRQVIKIYNSRDNKNAFDLRVEYDLCEKWIVQGFDKKNLIILQLKKKNQPKRQQKYEQKQREYRPARQYAPQHTSYTRYQPKHIEYRQKQSTKPYHRESSNNTNNQQQKKKYIEKNPLAEQIEQKVEEQLKKRKLQKNDKKKKNSNLEILFQKSFRGSR